MHVLLIILILIGSVFCLMTLVALIKKPSSIYKNKPEERNPMEGMKVVFIENENDNENADGVRGHLEACGESKHKAGVYEKVLKRLLDIILSFGGLLVLSPVFLLLSLWIVIDDPGPVLFVQKEKKL